MAAVDGDDVLELLALGLALFDQRDEFGADEHDFAAGVIQDVGNFGRRQTPIDSD